MKDKSQKTLGYFLLKGLLRLLGHLPLNIHYALSGVLCWLVRDVVRYRYDTVLTNIARSFPEKNDRECRAILKEFYRHFADLVVESIWFGACNAKRLRKARIMEVVNPEAINALWEKSPSMMVMYSHCGNWELYGGIGSYNYTDTPLPFTEQNFCVVYKEMSSAVWDHLMKENRFAPLEDPENFPGYVESRDLVRYAFRHRDERKVYNVNTDQRPYYTGSDNIRLRFMNQDCATMSASAAIAHKFGMSVMFLRMDRAGRGKYRLEYIPICEDASKMSVEAIMLEYYRLLEEELKAQPENYLWTHRRWA